MALQDGDFPRKSQDPFPEDQAMEIGRKNQKELHTEDSWIPKTPFKPILPKPQVIYTNRQGNQLHQANGLGSKGFSTVSSQETRDGMLSACLDSAANGNWEATLGAQKGIAGAVETCREFPINGSARWNFTSLLALQGHATADPTIAASHRIEDFSVGSNRSRISGNYSLESQYAQPIPHGPVYDLNLPPATAAASKTTSQSHIIPLTPEKDATARCRQVTQMQYVYTCQKENQQRNEQENQTATAAVDTKRFQTDRELQELTKDSSSAAICTVIEENQSSGNAGSHTISLDETPQRKPKRRRHRPKVITEGKPRTKPVATNPSPSTESPTRKRKYVRKKPLNKAPTTAEAEYKENPTGERPYMRKKPLNEASRVPTLEVTTESIDPKALEPTNKSCRRSLNFDIEGKPADNSSGCKLNYNEDSQPQEQDVSRANQSKSIITIGHGIEILVEATQAGIQYNLADSVNQMLKDYMSIPEKQAPSTPLPKKTNPPRRERNDNFQESHSKVEVATHTVQQNTTQIMLPADTPLPSVNPDNNSNPRLCTILTDKGKANGSKRKHLSFVQQPDSGSTNLAGIRYNSLPAYQIMFPSICKKRRTEKGQNSTTSSTSCVTAAKDIGRLEEICPQKDASRGPSTSTSNCLISASHSSPNGIPGAHGETGGLQCELKISCPIINQTERSRRKRSKRPSRIQGLAPHAKTATRVLHQSCTAREVPANYNVHQVEDSNRPHSCVEALVAEMRGTLTTKKRTKKRICLAKSASSSTNEEQSPGKIILYNQNQFLAKSLGTSNKNYGFSYGAPQEVIWKQISPVDAIVEQLQQLDINKESCGIACKEHSALVPYDVKNEENALVLHRRDGTITPFADALEPIKKRRPRPKVYLDEETNRVWKLLMGNINSEGIDGTDEEKAKWWEEEREVFRGRTNSFIARMHLVQGDRRFSQWKGSVVDSVIGVFLTQNVSDHLSSSAFMSLAAHFPLKSRSNINPCCEERTSSMIEKPIVSMPDLEDAIKWNEMSNQSVCDQSSMTLLDSEPDEEQEVVNSNESSTSSNGIVSCRSGSETYYQSKAERSTKETARTADNGYIEEMRSAKNDAFSSQNSVDSPSDQTAKRMESSPWNNSEADLIDRSKFNGWNSSNSFMKLLMKAGSNELHEVHSHGNGTSLSNQNSKDECDRTHDAGNDFHMQKTHSSPKSSSKAYVASSNNCHLYHIPNFGGLGVDCYKMIAEQTRCYEASNNSSRNSMKEQSSFTSESGSPTTDENNLTVAAQEASISPTPNNKLYSEIEEGQHISTLAQGKTVEVNVVGKSLDQNQIQNNGMQKEQSTQHPGGTFDIVETSSTLNVQQNNSQKLTASDLIERGLSEVKEINDMNATTRKAKSRRVGKEIKENVDWDALRKQAEANGKKRQRTPDTMDSLDWEAVRCAHVNEIANTIKERGMNNMLAERIKNFLNRLVRDHGGIDLEWLRDVPPDKAKEYLLSVRGLGLKSVECVRLLTLQHLAFPVDTNVGRIAVRLGWVPLQPLPESLQLHLLELYPVLESIQKYIWPRLCKLDQRTLYELHYQMITFGKVFCTKSKPNCNACPMRGECRHFASAFASARLALPGPEQKSIISATKSSTNEQNNTVMVDQLRLLATGQLEGNQLPECDQQLEARYGVSNCEPIVEEPSSPEPECPEVTEADMEDTFCEDPDEIPTIKLNIEEFTQNLQNYMQENMELQEGDVSKALVALTAEAASIPAPKLKNVSQLRTEHQVYELPDSHPLLQGLDRREPDDPCSYLLAIWTPGETANSIQPPESRCNSQENGQLCDEKTCFSCNSIREANSQIVRGTLLIPCRTAMRGSFPLNGTYFQVNEVFADHDSSLNPIDVPRTWIWNLPRRTVYFGTSIPTIFKGLTTEGIQHCFWRGYVCVRGFDQKTRAPRPLIARLHFPASKLNRTRGRDSND